MEPKRPSVLKNSAFFATLFALALVGSYLFVNWPSLALQVQYVTGTLPESRQLTAESYLEIPRLRLRAPIILADEDQKNNLGPLLLQGVVHHPETALPGQTGNGVYIGHSSNYWWVKSNYNTVFTLLDKLERDDEIFINFENNTYRYLVTEQKAVGKGSSEIFDQPDPGAAEITLVTCWPNGTDLKRFFVRAALAE